MIRLLMLMTALIPALRTDDGRDFQARVMGDGGNVDAGSGDMRPADYIALTEDSGAPASGSSTLTGELTGDLGREQATYAHTDGTATYTLTNTWTSDQSATVRKIGVFNASSNGTLVFETELNAEATLVSGDQLQVTETVTL